jgi:hypothetical protein
VCVYAAGAAGSRAWAWAAVRVGMCGRVGGAEHMQTCARDEEEVFEWVCECVCAQGGCGVLDDVDGA